MSYNKCILIIGQKQGIAKYVIPCTLKSSVYWSSSIRVDDSETLPQGL